MGLLGALAGLLLGCSSSGDKHHEAGLPQPAPGKVAAFDLNTLSVQDDADRVLADTPSLSHVASDTAGDVYLMDTSDDTPNILRLTSKGIVSRFAPVPSGSTPVGMAVTAPNVLAIGRKGGLLRVDGHGTTAWSTGHRFAYPDPIGSRPDGSLVVLDADRVWSVKDGRTTVLAGAPSKAGSLGTVDGSGTTYALLNGTTIGDLQVIPPGKPAYPLHVSGLAPGTQAPVSALTLRTIAPAGSDGFYAVADNAAGTTSYLVHVRDTKAEVLAQTRLSHDEFAKGCAIGKQYDALDNPCTMPWFALPFGNRILLLGQASQSTPTPTLVLSATSPPAAPR